MGMKIEIRAGRLRLTEATRRHVVRRLEHALHHSRVWIESVEVQLAEHPRGGSGTFCRVLVRLAQLPAVVITNLGSDLFAVVDKATAEAGRNVGRRMALRLRTKRRFGMMRMRPAAA
jgi:ribosome-associated translation inhibitor RaiA